MTTVYGKPNCVQCNMTEKYLTNAGTTYNKIDVTQDADAYALITGLGYLQVPVVVTESGHHFSGFIPDELAKLS